MKNDHFSKSPSCLGGYLIPWFCPMIWIEFNHISILLHQNPDLLTNINRFFVDPLTAPMHSEVWNHWIFNEFIFAIENVLHNFFMQMINDWSHFTNFVKRIIVSLSHMWRYRKIHSKLFLDSLHKRIRFLIPNISFVQGAYNSQSKTKLPETL